MEDSHCTDVKKFLRFLHGEWAEMHSPQWKKISKYSSICAYIYTSVPACVFCVHTPGDTPVCVWDTGHKKSENEHRGTYFHLFRKANQENVHSRSIKEALGCNDQSCNSGLEYFGIFDILFVKY